MKLYVEGGGDSKALKTECRRGFTEFLAKARLRGNKPRIVACGTRRNAYESFCKAIQGGEEALLLIDSEAPVSSACRPGDNPDDWNPWRHLRERQDDQWDKPQDARNADCHLMVQCMEAWFLADRENLQKFFGQDFNANALPPEGNPVEGLKKEQIYHALSGATRPCGRQKQYNKGQHSFKLLALISPGRVMDASPWAKRFVDAVRDKMGR